VSHSWSSSNVPPKVVGGRTTVPFAVVVRDRIDGQTGLATLLCHRYRRRTCAPRDQVYTENSYVNRAGTWWGMRQRSRGAWKGRRGTSGGTYVLLLWVVRPFRRFARRHLYVDCATIDVIFCPFSEKTNRTAKDDVRPADDLNTKSEPPVDIPPLDLVSCVFVFVRTDGASGAGEKPRCPPNTWPPPFCRGGGVMFLLLLWSSYSDKLMGSR